jgi:hypothetical protein
VLGELGRERRDVLVERERLGVQGIGLVCDRGKEAKSIAPEQRTLRRADEPTSEVDGRHAGGMPVADRFTQAPDVAPSAASEPVTKAPMDVAAPIIRNVTGRRRTNQIVRQSEHLSGFDCYPAAEELPRRLLCALWLPAAEAGRIRERQRPRGHREQRKQGGGVGARTAQARSNQETRVDLDSTTPDERLDPERRPTGLVRQLTRHVASGGGRERLHQLECLFASQRPELEPLQAVGRQHLRERVGE